MAIRNVVTDGFGNGTYSPGIKFVVTDGFAISTAVIVLGPFCAQAMQVFVAGAVAGDVFVAGAEKLQVFVAGAVAGEISCE